MSWTRLSNSKRKKDQIGHITLSPWKTVTLSKGFVSENNLREVRHKEAEFLFNPNSQLLALSFEGQPSKDSFKVTYDKRNIGGPKIKCARIFTAFGIDPKENAGRYSYTIRKIDGSKRRKFYVIDLKKPGLMVK